MNKEIGNLRKKVINLDEQVKSLSHFIRTTEDFINEKGKYYTSEESIKAINKMTDILNNKKQESYFLSEELGKTKSKLRHSCQHEILVKDELNNFCVICGELIIDIPITSLLQITMPNMYSPQQINIRNTIQEIIAKGIESNNLLGYVEEELEELQFEADISIRRLRK